MDKEIITFGVEIGKQKFYQYKSPTILKHVNIDNIIVFKKISSNEENQKYFIGYLYNDYKIKPLHKTLPKIKVYKRL